MRIDVMVDLETLGTDSNSTILQIAAAGFDITTGEIGAQFNKIADISTNESYEMTVSGSTLMWWMERPELFRELMHKGEGTSDELVTSFRNWLKGLQTIGDVYLWGNGILFDNAMLKEQMGDDYPIFFRNDRDVRTIVDLTCEKLGTDAKGLRDRWYDHNLEAHDAWNDVTNQVNLVRNCYRILTSRDPDEI